MRSFPPLASVAAVCRSVRLNLDAIPALVWNIDAFLDPSPRWSLPSASSMAVAPVRLMRRIAGHDQPEMDPFLKRKLFTDALVNAARRGDLDVARFLMEEYLPTGRARVAVLEMAEHDRLEMLK